MTEGMTLLRALATAGGYTDGPKPVDVVRDRGGEQVTLRFDTEKIERVEAEDPLVLPGDVIVVTCTDGQ